MAKFRSSAKQAKHAIEQKLALGSARHGNKVDGQIHSIRTAERYQQAAKNVSDWMKVNNHLQGLQNITPDQAKSYLSERAEQITQKTLDIERRAIETIIESKLERVHSLIRHTSGHRGYQPAQVNLIIQRMSERNKLATKIVQDTGIRAHELLTLQPLGERNASSHRTWSSNRFLGRENTHIWTVQGKGGLIREVAISDNLHHRLINTKLKVPANIIDRGANYIQDFNIGAGRSLSQNFSDISKDELGWSDGIHALRHNYARNRMNVLQRAGLNYYNARRIVSEEMGHFRGDITEHYLK